MASPITAAALQRIYTVFPFRLLAYQMKGGEPVEINRMVCMNVPEEVQGYCCNHASRTLHQRSRCP
jgi:hypothetical protein